jgi:hypothetical protein
VAFLQTQNLNGCCSPVLLSPEALLKPTFTATCLFLTMVAQLVDGAATLFNTLIKTRVCDLWASKGEEIVS